MAGYRFSLMTRSLTTIHLTHLLGIDPQQPEGGVRQGQEFLATVIPTGEWRDGIWHCFSIGLCSVQCCLTYWCMPIALGQVMTRLDLNWVASPRPADTSNTMSAFAFMVILVIVYAVGDMILALAAGPIDVQALETGEEPSPTTAALQSVRQMWEFVFGVFVLVVVCRTRQYVRGRYSIPPTCGDDTTEDCCCACCCGPCTVCQMARHTADYRQYHKGACCTPTGLVSPQVV